MKLLYRTSLASLGLLLAACGSTGSKGIEVGEAPSSVGGFPSQSFQDIVYVQARFDADAREVFGIDLLADEGVVPVALKLQLRGEGQDTARIWVSSAQMNPRLFLQDGTALPVVAPDRLASSMREKPATSVRQHAFQEGLLGSDATEGYLFFALEPEERFQATGTTIRATAGDVERELDVTRSLLAFEVSLESSTETFFVGIQ